MELAKVLTLLMPNVEWSISNNDLDTLEIHTEGISAPTQEQINNEIERLASAQETQAAAKAALLERLGITAEEAALLLGGN
jgi:hypothetical protein